jgi:hypothetical protein
MMRSSASLLSALALVGACASATPTAAPIATAPQTSTVGGSSQQPGGSGPAPSGTPASTRPTPNLAATPLVWFAPIPEVRLPGLSKGSADYVDLFPAGAAWGTAADHVQVFEIGPGAGLGPHPPEDVYRGIISGIADRGMALAMILGPLPHPLGGGSNTTCGDGVEGFAAPFVLDDIRNAQAVGARIDFVVFDEPLDFGHFFDGDQACQWSVERVAAETADFVKAVRAIEPNVVFGDDESAWASPEINAEDIGAWLDAYQAATGEPLGFLHLDVDWARPNWAGVAREIEGVVRAHGVPFGIIYNGGDAAIYSGDSSSGSNEQWLQLTAQRAYEYEQVAGGQPDHVEFASWHYYPTRVLPETDMSAFTSVIDRYFGQRTTLEADGARQVTLRTVAGAPVGGAELNVEAVPADGPYQELTLTGTVPAGASTAIVAVRANTEGAGPGRADLNIYSFAYSQNGGQNLVQNPHFSDDLYLWGEYGDGKADLVTSDRSRGRMLHVRATPAEQLYFDSAEFAVTPGASFEFRVATAVPLDSANSAYAAVIFLGGDEGGRGIINLAPAPLDLGMLTTDGSGQARPDLSALQPGRYQLRVSYAGDLQTWPVSVEQSISR